MVKRQSSRAFHKNQIGRAKRFIRANFSLPITIIKISKEAGASVFHFTRLFLAYSNETPFGFLRRVRILEAMKMLQEDADCPITEIALVVGYETPSSFNKSFKSICGFSPSEFRNLGQAKQAQTIYDLSKLPLLGGKMVIEKEYEIVKREEALFLYLENKGSFQEVAPDLWEQLFPKAFSQVSSTKVKQCLGLSIVDDSKTGEDVLLYQAGLVFDKTVSSLKGFKSKSIPKGKYAKFLLKGSYSNIAQAFSDGFKILAEKGIKIRDEFCIENYLNSPQDTPEEKLLTEILIPIEK